MLLYRKNLICTLYKAFFEKCICYIISSSYNLLSRFASDNSQIKLFQLKYDCVY